MLSEIHRKKKNADIGLAVVAVLLALGLLFFEGSEDLWTAFGMAAAATGFATFFILDEREYRARSRDSDGP